MKNDLLTAKPQTAAASMHGLGVVCGLAAGVWLGGAEAPTKLVNIGISPFAISLAMVLGVFVARWTLPTLLKGTDYVFRDLFTRPHLIVVAAFGASLLWGTMYVPYRKAYISGMNPLSFVTVFTVGELGTMALLAATFGGGVSQLHAELSAARHVVFWIFLGGFCWVVGDLFQQYATKYIGIGRGIPLSNTNQLWGLAWGALVFGELAHVGGTSRWLVVLGSALMILGAMFISTAAAPACEQASGRDAISRECEKYGLSFEECVAAQLGSLHGEEKSRRPWWVVLIVAGAVAVFLWLGLQVRVPGLAINFAWVAALCAVLLVAAAGCGWLLWRRTRFS